MPPRKRKNSALLFSTDKKSQPAFSSSQPPLSRSVKHDHKQHVDQPASDDTNLICYQCTNSLDRIRKEFLVRINMYLLVLSASQVSMGIVWILIPQHWTLFKPCSTQYPGFAMNVRTWLRFLGIETKLQSDPIQKKFQRNLVDRVIVVDQRIQLNLIWNQCVIVSLLSKKLFPSSVGYLD